jgi:hypothetical protein
MILGIPGIPGLGSAEPEIRPAKHLPLQNNPDYGRPFTGVIFDLSPDRGTMGLVREGVGLPVSRRRINEI